MPDSHSTTARGAPRTIQRCTPDEAGTWVSEHQGIRAPVRMVTIAIRNGWQETTALDAALYEWARYPERKIPEALQELDSEDLIPEAWSQLVDEISEWFNAALAPPGHHFRWHEGAFVLASDVDWCEVDNPLRCDDASHTHGAAG